METDELAERLFTATLDAMDVLTIHLGDQLGLYRLLHQSGALTSAEVAAAVPMNGRYAREWLEQQTVAGLLVCEDADRPAEERRYLIPPEHVPVLADPDSTDYLLPVAQLVAAAGVQLPALVAAYRIGGGVPWSQYGAWMRTAQADANRPLFLRLLGREWLPALPEVDKALSDGGRVADLGCGEGWSSIGIALSYPTASVDGFDLDEPSVEMARRHAEEYGVADRVRFHHADAGAVPAPERAFDLVAAFECVHDLPDPVSFLATARRLAGERGTVLVMDERVADRFTGPGDEVERLMYGFSTLICLPDGMSHPGSRATGTVLRPGILRGYAEEAGFTDVEVLPIENELFRFYRLS